MLDLSTLAGLHAHQHELHAFCPRCERWSVIDLERIIQAGHGERRLPITVRCRSCGEVGRLQVRPPMPRWQGSTWMG
jgi:RNase P subunit RPR2